MMSGHQSMLSRIRAKTKTTVKTTPKYIYVSHNNTIYRYSPGGLRIGIVNKSVIPNEKIYTYKGSLNDKNFILNVLNSPYVQN